MKTQNDELILSEIQKECEDYITNHTGAKLGESSAEIYHGMRFLMLRIAKIERLLVEVMN